MDHVALTCSTHHHFRPTGSGAVQWVWFAGGLDAVLSVTRASATQEGLHQDARQRSQESQIRGIVGELTMVV